MFAVALVRVELFGFSCKIFSCALDAVVTVLCETCNRSRLTDVEYFFAGRKNLVRPIVVVGLSMVAGGISYECTAGVMVCAGASVNGLVLVKLVAASSAG